MVHRPKARPEHQNLAQLSEAVMENRIRFFGHVTTIPSGHFVQVVLRMLPDPNWKRPPGRRRKLWTKVMKEDFRTPGVDKQFSRDVRSRRLGDSDGWINSIRTLGEDQAG
ncbi:hypothetical protein RB195_021537 [Necator americanus]|uniref:Uncharacterized protein n=1 Tax=Necator americanus TaxID=51031 RepID=A0ABR1EC75_NECAM